MNWQQLAPYLVPLLVIALIVRRALRAKPQRVRPSRLWIGPVYLAVGMTLVLWLAHAPVAAWVGRGQGLRDLLTLLIVGTLGSAVYGGIVLALFGRDWLKAFRARRRR